MKEIVEKTLTLKAIDSHPIKNIDCFEHFCAIVGIIPGIGAYAQEIQAIRNFVSEYKAYEFFRKFARFIYELNVSNEEVDEQQRKKFVAEIEEVATDAAGHVIIGLVDRLDNINKEKILANLVKARVTAKISIEDFFRLSSMLERIPYVDLIHLDLYLDDYYDENGDSELLFATGVLQQSVIDEENGNKYRLSKLGTKLLEYGVQMEVPEVPFNGTKVAGLEEAKTESISDEEINSLF